MKPVFKIDNVDFTSYIKSIKISSNDIDASNSGRSNAGTMRRKRIATKMKLQIETRSLLHAQMLSLESALSPETVSITYVDPRYSTARTASFYGSTINNGEQTFNGVGVQWDSSSFSLIEV